MKIQLPFCALLTHPMVLGLRQEISSTQLEVRSSLTYQSRLGIPRLVPY